MDLSEVCVLDPLLNGCSGGKCQDDHVDLLEVALGSEVDDVWSPGEDVPKFRSNCLSVGSHIIPLWIPAGIHTLVLRSGIFSCTDISLSRLPEVSFVFSGTVFEFFGLYDLLDWTTLIFEW